MKTAKAEIGSGIYTMSDINQILMLSKNHKTKYFLNAYIKGEFKNKLDYNFTFGTDNNLVNFKTLINFYVFFELKKRNFSYKKILNSYVLLSEQLKTPFPFNEVLLSTLGQKEIYAETTDGMYNVLDKKMQFELKEILKPLVNKVEVIDGTIARFYPLGIEKSVVVDPKIQFGSPTIKGTRIDIDSINSLYKAGESKDLIARVYNLSIRQVNDAIEFSKAA